MSRWPALALLLVCAPVRGQADVFRYKFAPGQVITTRNSAAGATMAGKSGGAMRKMQFRTNATSRQVVRSVSGGVVTLEVTDTSTGGQMTADGQTQNNPRTAPTRSVVRLTTRGHFLSRKSLGKEDAEEDKSGDPTTGTDALFGLNFPDRDVKPGDTWEDTLSVGTGANAKKVHVTWKYLERVQFRGRDCVKITATFSMPVDPGPAEEGAPKAEGRMGGAVTTYFDPAAGMEVYSSGYLTVVAKADLTALSPDAGEGATVMRINLVQSLVQSGKGR